jgi:hypothetical protein
VRYGVAPDHPEVKVSRSVMQGRPRYAGDDLRTGGAGPCLLLAPPSRRPLHALLVPARAASSHS